MYCILNSLGIVYRQSVIIAWLLYTMVNVKRYLVVHEQKNVLQIHALKRGDVPSCIVLKIILKLYFKHFHTVNQNQNTVNHFPCIVSDDAKASNFSISLTESINS